MYQTRINGYLDWTVILSVVHTGVCTYRSTYRLHFHGTELWNYKNKEDCIVRNSHSSLNTTQTVLCVNGTGLDLSNIGPGLASVEQCSKYIESMY